MDNRLMIRCSGCGDAIVIARETPDGLRMPYELHKENYNSFLDGHWPHVDPDKPLGEAFTLEDDESMKEATK
jgi:hypothetical protein